MLYIISWEERKSRCAEPYQEVSSLSTQGGRLFGFRVWFRSIPDRKNPSENGVEPGDIRVPAYLRLVVA